MAHEALPQIPTTQWSLTHVIQDSDWLDQQHEHARLTGHGAESILVV